MVGSAGFMAPGAGDRARRAGRRHLRLGRDAHLRGQRRDAVGTRNSDAILYRILHIEPDTSAVPDLLRPMVEAALAKDPQRRPGPTNCWPG